MDRQTAVAAKQLLSSRERGVWTNLTAMKTRGLAFPVGREDGAGRSTISIARACHNQVGPGHLAPVFVESASHGDVFGFLDRVESPVTVASAASPWLYVSCLTMNNFWSEPRRVPLNQRKQ